MTGIRLSEKHGVNPAIPKCFYCLGDKNELLLCGRLPKDQEAPRNMVWDMEPCDQCKAYMAQGIIVISVKDGEGEKTEADRALHVRSQEFTPARQMRPFVPNPYRTGGWWVMREEGLARILRALHREDKQDEAEKLIAHVGRCRWLLLEDTTCAQIGLEYGNGSSDEPAESGSDHEGEPSGAAGG